MKRIFKTFITITALSSLLISCSPLPDEGETKILTFNLGTEPIINPTHAESTADMYVIRETFDGLVRENNGIIAPAIAKSWDISEDGKQITFHLRKSNWSDGHPLTAHDFVYSWKRHMSLSNYQEIWFQTNISGAKSFVINKENFNLVGINASDDYTLQINLDYPTDYLLQILSTGYLMPVPKHIIENGNYDKVNDNWAVNPQTAVSNGPFVLKAFENDHIVLEKNTNFWDAENVKLDGITFYTINEESTAYTAYQNQDIMVLPNLPKDLIPTLLASNDELHQFRGLGTYYYNFNLEHDIWSDIRIRQAFNLAIDRQVIVDAIGDGNIAAYSFVQPGFFETDKSDFNTSGTSYQLQSSADSLKRAKTLLAQAGYPDGKGFPEIELLYNSSESHQKIAELVQEMLLKNLGIKIRLVNQEWAVVKVRREEKDFQFSKGSWTSDYMDPTAMLAIFTSKSIKNASSYNNPEFDQLILEASRTSGQEHFDLLHQAEAILMRDLPLLPIYHYTDSWLINASVVGWEHSIVGIMDFSRADIIRTF